MEVTAWNNGKQYSDGNGYGIKLNPSNRDLYFNREWKNILIELEGDSIPAEVNIDKASFWNNTCHELISKEIGIWLIQNRLAPWEKNNAPKLNLIPLNENIFRLER